MPYRLEANETIADGMRRLLTERVNQIIDHLTNPEIDRDIGVHESRKNCKRIRAAYRLIRDEIGMDLYRQENIRFRDTARLLAGARDSWVMIRTLDRLIVNQTNLSSLAFAGLRLKLVEQYEATLARELENQHTIPAIVENMHLACAQIENLPIRNEDFTAFRGGIRRVYRRGQRAMNLAYTQPTPEIFHEWRKRVKYLWHQLEILEDLWPNLLAGLAEELHALSDYLGDDHDLAILRSVILDNVAGFGAEDELMRLIRLIDQERLNLESLAHPLGDRLYFEAPKNFIRRMEIYWEAWQKEDKAYQAELVQRLQKSTTAIFPLDDALLTTSEVAARLEISPNRVRQLIHGRKLPAEKVGTVWIIKVEGQLVPDAPAEDASVFEGVLLSTREAADHLRITPEKVRALIISGELAATKTGRIWVIREGDLALFLPSQPEG